MQAAGAYRGYGATQGIFAVESAADELAHKMGMDPVKIPRAEHAYGGRAHFRDIRMYRSHGSCTMDKCLAPCKGNDRTGMRNIRSVIWETAKSGVSVSPWPCRAHPLQGVDVGGADIKLNEDGSYTLALGCTDMGTGCDTIHGTDRSRLPGYSRWKISWYSVWIRIFHHMIQVPMPHQPPIQQAMAVMKACGGSEEKDL